MQEYLNKAKKESSITSCVLVKGSRPLGRIVIDDASFHLAEEAIHELRVGIAKSTGARLSMDCCGKFKVILEEQFDTPVAVLFKLLSSRDSALGKDGYKICVSEDSIEFQAETQFGFRNAVYKFLSQYCGFEWLWPGPDGEVYDSMKTLEISIGQTQQTPDYLWRHILDCHDEIHQVTGGHSAYEQATFHMRSDRFVDGLLKQWYQRNGLGGLKIWYGHSWGLLLNPDEYGKEHPEYFAEVNGSREESLRNWTGKHGGQICTTNPDVINLIIEKIRKFFDIHPEYDAFSISPNDGNAFCECDRCIALDVSFGNMPSEEKTNISRDMMHETFRDNLDKTGPSSRITGPITDRIFIFANQIAEQIAESHPDKLLQILVYNCYREPPKKVKLASNVIAQFCVSCHQHFSEEHRRADHENISTLANNVQKIGIYEYFDQGAWPGVVRLFPDLIKDSVSFFYAAGVRYYQTQAAAGFATNGFNLWFLAKALWDSSVDVDQALDAYCRKAFGPAAMSMKNYYNLWRECWETHQGLTKLGDHMPGKTTEAKQLTPFDQLRRLYTVDFLRHCEEAIEQARSSAPVDSAARRRIDFVKKGLEATQLAVQAANEFYRLVEEEGWPEFENEVSYEKIYSLGNIKQINIKAEAALKLWDQWEGFLEIHRNDFVIGHMWARYCYDSRRLLHPHATLRKIKNICECRSRKSPTINHISFEID